MKLASQPFFLDVEHSQALVAKSPPKRNGSHSSPSISKKRMGEPSEVAKVVSFVLSDEASFINGADLMVDGGLHARYAS